MTPTMIIKDFEDDYKSDECDEHVAVELFYNAFFCKQSISTSCEEFMKSKQCPTSPKTEATAEIALTNSVQLCVEAHSNELAACSDMPTSLKKPELLQQTLQPVPKNVAVESVRKKCENSAASCTTGRKESDDEGIATKLEFQVSKTKRTSAAKSKSSPKQTQSAGARKTKRNDVSDDSDDINANIKAKRKRAKLSADAVIAAKCSRKSASSSAAKIQECVLDDDDDIEYFELDSTEFPILLPDLTSEDEISLSDADGIELNVVSFARGIPDKVSLTPGLTREEHKRLWHVDIDDKFRHLRKNRYHSVKECRNCRQSGHLAFECREPERIVCILCGDRTHIAARCPDKMCSTCKLEGHVSLRCYRMQHLLEEKCRICSVFGHTEDICPDSWRRYHCTTREGPPIAPEKDEKLPYKRKFCSWCGLQGHFAFECRKAGNAGIASRLVHSYEGSDSKRSKFLNTDSKKPTKKRKKPKAARRCEQIIQAEHGRASVFGSDFISLSGPSGKKLKPTPGPGPSNTNPNRTSRKTKQTQRSFAFKQMKKKAKLEPEYGGIEMLPSVQKRQRNNESVGSDGERPQNRRKERRKLKRMQLRNDREKTKKKHLKRKGNA